MTTDNVDYVDHDIIIVSRKPDEAGISATFCLTGDGGATLDLTWEDTSAYNNAENNVVGFDNLRWNSIAAKGRHETLGLVQMLVALGEYLQPLLEELEEEA